MKSLEKFGAAIIDYEGVANITFHEESGKVFKGYFQAKQLKAGGIAIGFLPLLDDEDYPSGKTTLELYRPEFSGRDLDNWHLTTHGQTSRVPNIGFFGAPKSSVEPALVFGASGLKARRKGATNSGYIRSHFFVFNLFWHIGNMKPNPITLKVRGLLIRISPVDDYLELADNIKAVRGIAPTADVTIETSDRTNLTLSAFADFMDDLMHVFRLVTGNRIDWLFGEGLDDKTGRAVERLHKNAVTGPFSTTMSFKGRLDLQGLTTAFFDSDHQVLSQETLKELINYFVNCCDETSFLEARGLLASTLADLLVLRHSEAKVLDQIMKRNEFNARVLPTLKSAIESVQLPELCDELQGRAAEVLQGAYRRSFRKRLDRLSDELELPLSEDDCKRVVQTRNELVHNGRYPSTNRDDWHHDYMFMIWMDFVTLCRLSGYEGDLPFLMEGRRLWV